VAAGSQPGRRDVQGFTVELPPQDDPEVGHELILVRHADGRTEELRLHDYERLYELPGVYEQIVQERLGCRSPDEIASMLGETIDALGWDPAQTRVLDVAAGNGVSGQALVAQGLRPVIGTDIVPSARDGALRDRPGVYDAYLTLDLLALTADQEDAIRAKHPNVLACVAPVGEHTQQLPPLALAAAAGLLGPDALVAYMHDPTFGTPDRITQAFWADRLGPGTRSEVLERRRYLHRYTVNGVPFEMDGIVWRLRRG
jgi:predicted TPR repeat methyltransferase